MHVNNKVAIVTGASSGVGAEAAFKLASLGARIVVNYAHSQAGAERTVARIVEAGGEASIFQADVSDNLQCVALVAAAVERYGQLDILLNNAGTTTFVEHQDLDGLTDEIWHRILTTNLQGPFYMSRAALPEMIKQGGGEIVMTSSIAGLTTHGSSLAYCASKAGLNSLTKTLAKTMGKHGVRVNAICPGLIDGEWGSEGWGDNWDTAKDFTRAETPLGQITKPGDIADGLLALITGSDLMTGQIITLDGGFTL